jgi:hypothetical protein
VCERVNGRSTEEDGAKMMPMILKGKRNDPDAEEKDQQKKTMLKMIRSTDEDDAEDTDAGDQQKKTMLKILMLEINRRRRC